ncbi:hypothetical protein ACSBR1_013058 [Camellia fascicularis]
MAFSNRFGSLMRQTISQNSISNGQVSMASMLNAIHCMSSSKLFIEAMSFSLSFGTDDQSLREAFSGFCDVLDAELEVVIGADALECSSILISLTAPFKLMEKEQTRSLDCRN